MCQALCQVLCMHYLLGSAQLPYNKEIALPVSQGRKLRWQRQDWLLDEVPEHSQGRALGGGPHCGPVGEPTVKAGKEPGKVSGGQRALSPPALFQGEGGGRRWKQH